MYFYNQRNGTSFVGTSWFVKSFARIYRHKSNLHRRPESPGSPSAPPSSPGHLPHRSPSYPSAYSASTTLKTQGSARCSSSSRPTHNRKTFAPQRAGCGNNVACDWSTRHALVLIAGTSTCSRLIEISVSTRDSAHSRTPAKT